MNFSREYYAPRQHSAMPMVVTVWDWVSPTSNIWWVETRNATQPLTMHRTPPLYTVKNYLAPNIGRAVLENSISSLSREEWVEFQVTWEF